MRAKQHYMKDEGSRRKAMSILLHGDAAFAGQVCMCMCVCVRACVCQGIVWGAGHG